MILTSCPHCRRAVSDHAQVCAYCGGAITPEAKAEMAAGMPGPIRQTVAALKFHRLVAIGRFWGGILLAALATPSVTSNSEPQSSAALLMPLLTLLMIFAGVMWYAVTKLRLRYRK